MQRTLTCLPTSLPLIPKLNVKVVNWNYSYSWPHLSHLREWLPNVYLEFRSLLQVPWIWLTLGISTQMTQETLIQHVKNWINHPPPTKPTAVPIVSCSINNIVILPGRQDWEHKVIFEGSSTSPGVILGIFWSYYKFLWPQPVFLLGNEPR